MRGSFSTCAIAAAVSDGCRRMVPWDEGFCDGGSTSMGLASVSTSGFTSTFTSGFTSTFTSGFTSVFAWASASAAALSIIAAVAIASW